MQFFLESEALINEPMPVIAFLLGILAILFALNSNASTAKIFKYLPFLVFAYFVPTLFSNTGVIPIQSPAYTFIKDWFLPASLLLMTLSADIPAILSLGRNAVLLFLTATTTIVIGGPIAYLILHPLIPETLKDDAWKGLAALSGSWIGGGANMTAIKESVGLEGSTFNLMIVVDVAVANVWMAFLLIFAGKQKEMDEKINADSSTVDACRQKVEELQAKHARPSSLSDLIIILAIAFVSTAFARYLPVALDLPNNQYITTFTWIVMIVTVIGIALSFTNLARSLEGAGASKVGSVFLYMLVASIGARGDFSRIGEAWSLVLIGGLWMLIHAVILLLVRRLLRAPIFFAAVGSKANIGGAASAPIVAAAFHPSLAPVGILLAGGGYAVGTIAGQLCAFLLRFVHENWVG